MSNVNACLGTYFEQVKRLSSENKVAIPEVIARCVIHVLTSDGADATLRDLLSDAPRSQRGRKPLDPQVKADREALRAASKGKGDVATLRAAIDRLMKANG